MVQTDVLSAVFSNLGRASEKQQLYEIAERYGRLAEFYAGEASEEVDIASLRAELADDLESAYPRLQTAGTDASDRGVLRALKWGEKVTTAQRALVDRYLSKGEELVEGKKLFVCEACGFIFLGDGAPDICPVCKAPASRFSVIR